MHMVVLCMAMPHAFRALCGGLKSRVQEAMEWFKANPGREDGGGLTEQYSVQDDNSDTSSVAGTDSTTGTGSRPRTGMGHSSGFCGTSCGMNIPLDQSATAKVALLHLADNLVR